MQSTAIIVSPHFPPSTLAGVHRARHLAKHLPSAGWKPIVVCVDERFHKETTDPSLTELMPATTHVVKVGALPAGLCRRIGVGDIGIRGWFQLRATLHELLRANPGAIVMITGGPFYPMTMSAGLKGMGVPVVLDFQDPWVSVWGGSQKLMSKAGVSHWVAEHLEPRALRGACFVTSVSETQNREMAARYPWLDATRMAAIPIGGDPDDFDSLRQHQLSAQTAFLQPDKFNFSFVGTFMPRSGSLMRLVLKAYRRVRSEAPELWSRVRLNFVGTSNQPDDMNSYQVMPIAEEVGVAEAVREVPQRLPYLDALSILARSDAVLLVGSDEPHYTASKIYPALMSGRPFLSFFHQASSSHTILSGAGGGLAYAYAPQRSESEMVAELASGFGRMVSQPDRLGRVDPAAYAPYEARAIATSFATIYESIRRID